MPRCPNCSYILVLLERRGKYKCAKCGKLYPQKEIDDKEFREHNKRQKERDKDDYERQRILRLKHKPHRHKVSSREKQKKLTEYKDDLRQSDIFTLRRIVPRDRGKKWSDAT